MTDSFDDFPRLCALYAKRMKPDGTNWQFVAVIVPGMAIMVAISIFVAVNNIPWSRWYDAGLAAILATVGIVGINYFAIGRLRKRLTSLIDRYVLSKAIWTESSDNAHLSMELLPGRSGVSLRFNLKNGEFCYILRYELDNYARTYDNSTIEHFVTVICGVAPQSVMQEIRSLCKRIDVDGDIDLGNKCIDGAPFTFTINRDQHSRRCTGNLLDWTPSSVDPPEMRLLTTLLQLVNDRAPKRRGATHTSPATRTLLPPVAPPLPASPSYD